MIQPSLLEALQLSVTKYCLRENEQDFENPWKYELPPIPADVATNQNKVKQMLLKTVDSM